MPVTREEHVLYTRKELLNYEYYVNVINRLKNENVVSYIDIGANVGEFCNVLFEKLETLKMGYLIEPETENYAFMLNNVVNKNNITPINIGIGYNIKNAGLVKFNNNVGGFKIVENFDGQKITVKTLEELDLPIVDLVKIDVEGFEYNIIENSTYLQKIKWIEVEFHDYENKPLKEYVKLYFPNHSIIEIEKLEGRCLLKKNNYA
jgi:FkbM family methyltransferase